MQRKVAIVTGANKGIGFGIVRGLCKNFEGDVYLTSRDEGRGRDAVEILKNEGLSPKFHPLDVTCPESRATFISFLQATYAGVDIVVNNAGIIMKNCCSDHAPEADSCTHEEAVVTCRTNFFAAMDFTNEIAPLLKRDARVVNISSSCGFLKKINGQAPQSLDLQKRFADPNLTEAELCDLVNNFIELTKTNTHYSNGWPHSAYDVTKVAITSLTRIHQKKFDTSRPDEDILVNSVHPGYVDTDMTKHRGRLTIDEGADAAIWLALLPPNDASSPRGGYVWYDRTIVDWVNGPTPSKI